MAPAAIHPVVRMTAPVDIATFMTDPSLLGPFFQGPSWDRWKAVLKAAYGLSLTSDERKLFVEVAEREPPRKRVREVVGIAGRRGGKDSIASAVTSYEATVPDRTGRLRPGERAVCVSLGCDREQARVQHRYTSAYFAAVPLLADLVENETQDGLELKNRSEIAIGTNSFRSIRGRAMASAVLTECAFFRDETSSNPDRELYNAIMPSLVTLDGMLICISSPWKQSGLLWDKFRKHYGQNDDDVLVVRGASRLFNPTIPQRVVDQALEDDPAAAAAEWMAEFRSDLSGFLDPEWVERAAVLEAGEMARPPSAGPAFGSLDPSGGRKDRMTASVAWKDGDNIIVGALRARKPPFNPDTVAEEFAAMFKRYGLKTVRADNYAAEWVVAAFARHGIAVQPSKKSRSEIYLESEPLFARGSIKVPNDKLLVSELRNLERKTHRGGRDEINHPKHGTDDCANAVCMAAWLAARRDPNQDIVMTGPIILGGPRIDSFGQLMGPPP